MTDGTPVSYFSVNDWAWLFKCVCVLYTVTIRDFLHTARVIITFRLSRRRREMFSGHVRLCVYMSVRGRMPTYCTDPDVTWGMVGVPLSCALLGRFANDARVMLL